MEIKQEGPIIVKASKDKKKINQKVSIQKKFINLITTDLIYNVSTY